MRRYPQLGPAKVLDALAFAYDNPELMAADLEREQALFDERGGPTQFARPLAQLALPFASRSRETSDEDEAPPAQPLVARSDSPKKTRTRSR